MQKLISYTKNVIHSFALEADLAAQGAELILEYRLMDPEALFELPNVAAEWTSGQVPRRDGLWQATCFEAFLQPEGSSTYFELNFSLEPAWNAYKFTAYREPQPPTASSDFALKAMGWDPTRNYLRVVLENHTKVQKFKVGLTAILQEKSGAKHYYAIAHKGPKADFHLSESFILQRGL